MTSVVKPKLQVFLLLSFFSSSLDSEVTLVKTIGNKPDFTPICTNETSNIILLIVCRIRTERNSGEECSLLYRDEGDFVHHCDSRFTLKTWNDTVFLHLTSLTPADSGNYTCECSNLDGTYILHLNITVKDPLRNDFPANELCSHFEEFILRTALSAAILLLLIISCIFRFSHRRYWGCLRTESSGSFAHGSATIKDEDDSDELYTNLQQPTCDVYQTISTGHCQHRTKITSTSDKLNVELKDVEMKSNREIYENLCTKSLPI